MNSFKIDLHSQTIKSVRNSDKISSFNKTVVLHSWKKEKVKIASFTDKNVFCFDFYKKWKKIAEERNILLIPGVEIVLKHNNKEQDMVINFSEKLKDEQLMEIENRLKFKEASFFANFDEIIKMFDEFNPLYIPHIGKSHNNCKYETLKDHLDKIFVIEATNINTANYKSFMKKTKNKYKDKTVHFSDTHRWSQYPEYGLKNEFFEEMNSFDEIYDFFKNKKIILNKQN